MALSASTVWEVRVGGSDTANGGGFVTGASGTDYSQQNSPQYSLTGLTSAGAGNVILTASASADMVGNILRVTGGTNFNVDWFEITSVSPGVSITCSLSRAGTAVAIGVGAIGTAAVGGALKSPAIASVQISGNTGQIAFLKNEGSVFSITSVTGGVAGGTISSGGVFAGYQTNRALINSDAPPTVQLNVSSATLILTLSGAIFSNIIVDGNSQTSARLTTANTFFTGCTVKGFNTVSTGNSSFFNCLVTGNSAAVCVGATFAFGVVTGNTAPAVNCGYAINVLAYGNTGASTHGIELTPLASISVAINCTAVGNGGDGIRILGVGAHYAQNCILQSNGGFGINGNSILSAILNNNAFFNNTSGPVSGAPPQTYNFNPITYTADAFTNSAGNVYTLNTVAGGGASLRGKSLPAIFPDGLTSDSLDMGAVQSSAAGMLFIPNLEGT